MVYGDREHFANLHFLTGFDPRFEEALLLVRPQGKPLLLVGNECVAYLPISPPWKLGQLRHERYQPFSLEDQPRNQSRTIEAIFREEGISAGSRIAAIGWKTYSNPLASDLPSYLVDTLRSLAGPDSVRNATGWLIHNLRVHASPFDLASFEANNVKASEAMRRIQFALRPGLSDQELLAEASRYDGTPLSCHMGCKTGPKRVSLASPSGNRIESGNTWSANIAYWGANICRSNWVAHDERDLPAPARDYVAAFAAPYFTAFANWLENLEEGAACSALFDQIHRELPQELFHIELNPGHLISYEEWPSSPFYADSQVTLSSGMVIQSDIIPSHPVYASTRAEDGYAIASRELQRTLQQDYPHAWKRISQRRDFLHNVLGIEIPDSLLPLSNTAGIVAPYALAPRRIFARAC
ncbi:M24 family metallopeptidase [Bryobacter aggregatus]|uniref:M24 family metallopeptidase n=1 Tax=Bryobacter aggregatus TaxID=360054 RepID=UPI0004E226E8|nr:M24 family metallopeptidase [Bryobacter aggregatus]